jgi:hypothetical protein
MSQEIIDTGSLPNDGTGDPLRVAFDKINNNFANLLALVPTANVELLDPNQFPETNVANANAQFSGNINITNNLYINNVPAVIEDPTAKMLTFDTSVVGPYGNQEYINIGATPNDGEGDPLRVAFGKINNNFSNLFFVTTNTYTTYTVGLEANQVLVEIPVTSFTQGNFQIRSSDTTSADSQNIILTAQITNNNLDVKYTGYGTTFSGNALTRYAMDVFDGNVRVLASPIVNDVLLHFIASQVTFIGNTVGGLNLQLDGYIDSDMATEDLAFDISTEQ